MKNSQNNLSVRIIAGVIALILIMGILFVTNAFVGNPISAMMANRAIEQYVNRNYSFLDLEVENAIYNFKTSGYMARAKSKTSMDTKFAIYYSNGKVQRDDYENYVLGGFNTLQRLSDEYSYIAKEIIAQELDFEDNRTMVTYNKDDYGNTQDIIKLDMKFDRNLPLDAEVIININLKNNSLEEVAEVLIEAHEVFLNNDCVFNKYGLYTEENNEGRMVSVHGVTPKDIEGGKLLEQLEKALEQDELRKKEIKEREKVENREDVKNMEEIKDKEVVEDISVYIRE
jgi:hypothetical protein